MKKLLIVLLLCCMTMPAQAQPLFFPTPSPTPTPLEQSAANLWDSLGKTWNALVDFGGEAGKVASTWVAGASKELDKFLAENAPQVKQWLDDTGAYFNENVSPELNEAWNILVKSAADIGEYTQAELQRAYDEIKSSLDTSKADPKIVEAVEHMAGAAGVKTE